MSYEDGKLVKATFGITGELQEYDIEYDEDGRIKYIVHNGLSMVYNEYNEILE